MADTPSILPDPPEAPSAQQLRLFPMFSPLVERLGRDFFRRVPALPGVYLMRDDAGRLLYVGKAGNLRQRLGCYRYPAGASGKTVRLLHAVRTIAWELCGSEAEARLRENALLRTQRPKFNRVGTWPQAYRFIQLERIDRGFRLSILATLDGQASGEANDPDLFADVAAAAPVARAEVFGAFKAGVSYALASLLRLLWQALNPTSAPRDFPRRLVPAKAPRAFGFDDLPEAAWLDRVRDYFAGASIDLVDAVAARLGEPRNTFLQLQQAADIEAAREFYQRGPRRNAELGRQLGRDNHLVLQEELDDLLVRAGDGARTSTVQPAITEAIQIPCRLAGQSRSSDTRRPTRSGRGDSEAPESWAGD